MDISTLLGGLQVVTMVGFLVIIVNIITGVFKQFTWAVVHTNVVAIVVSLIVTMVSMVAYWQINSMAIYWYNIVGALFLGIFTAYAAMYGFDKFKQIYSGSSTTEE